MVSSSVQCLSVMFIIVILLIIYFSVLLFVGVLLKDYNGNYLMMDWNGGEFIFKTKGLNQNKDKYYKYVWFINPFNRTITNRFYNATLFWQSNSTTSGTPSLYTFNDQDWRSQTPQFSSLPIIPFFWSTLSYNTSEGVYFLESSDGGDVSLQTDTRTKYCNWMITFI